MSLSQGRPFVNIPHVLINLASIVLVAGLWLLYINPQIRDGDDIRQFRHRLPQNRDEWMTLQDAFYRGLYGHSQQVFYRWGFTLKYWHLHMLVYLYAITAWVYMPGMHWTVATLLTAAGVLAMISYWYRYWAVRHHRGPVHDPNAPIQNNGRRNAAAH